MLNFLRVYLSEIQSESGSAKPEAVWSTAWTEPRETLTKEDAKRETRNYLVGYSLEASWLFATGCLSVFIL